MEGTNVLFSIGPVQITSTLVTMWVIILILTILSILATRKLKDVPGPLQNIAEMAVESLQNYFAGIMGAKTAKKYFPIFATAEGEVHPDRANGEEIEARWYTRSEILERQKTALFGSWALAFSWMWATGRL